MTRFRLSDPRARSVVVEPRRVIFGPGVTGAAYKRGTMRERPRLVARPLLIAVVVAVTVGGASGDAHAQGNPVYRIDAEWPQYLAGSQFEMGTGIAVDGDGTVYAISRDRDHWAGHPLAMSRYRGRGSIWMFDRTGTFLGKFADDQAFIEPHSIYIDRDGFVWVVDRDGHQVKKLTPDGAVVLTLGEYGRYGNDEAHFNGPTGVAFFSNGTVVVSDGYWNSRLVWFDDDGTFLKQVGEYGNGPGQFGVVHAVALDASGRLLVANVCGGALHPYVTVPGQIADERRRPIPNCSSRFDVWTQDGSYVGPWSAVDGALTLSIAAYGDRIYAGTTGRERGRQDVVIVDAETDRVVERIRASRSTYIKWHSIRRPATSMSPPSIQSTEVSAAAPRDRRSYAGPGERGLL